MRSILRSLAVTSVLWTASGHMACAAHSPGAVGTNQLANDDQHFCAARPSDSSQQEFVSRGQQRRSAVPSSPVTRIAGQGFRNENQYIIPFFSAGGWPFITIMIGEYNNNLNLMVDLTSSLTWVRSSLCKSGDECMDDKNKYTLTNKVQDRIDYYDSTEETYYDRSMIKCYTVYDTITVAGRTLSNHSICAASEIRSTKELKVDGIVAVPVNSTNAKSEILGSLLQRTFPDKQLISFWHNRSVISTVRQKDTKKVTTSDTSQTAGEISLGEPDMTKYVGNITWFDRTKMFSSWALSMEEVLYDGEHYINSGVRPAALLNAAERLIFLPDNLFSLTMDRMGARRTKSGHHRIDCSRVKTFPTITFVLQGVRFDFEWEKQFYIIKNRCYSVFAPAYPNFELEGAAIFGMYFLRHYYISFDIASERIGFAELSGPAEQVDIPNSSGTSNSVLNKSPSLFMSAYASLIVVATILSTFAL